MGKKFFALSSYSSVYKAWASKYIVFSYDLLLETYIPLHHISFLVCSWLARKLQGPADMSKAWVLLKGQVNILWKLGWFYILVVWLWVFILGIYSKCRLHFNFSLILNIFKRQILGYQKLLTEVWRHSPEGVRKITSHCQIRGLMYLGNVLKVFHVVIYLFILNVLISSWDSPLQAINQKNHSSPRKFSDSKKCC